MCISVGGVCSFLGSVSLQQRFEMADQCYSTVTAQFYSASKGQYTLKAWGRANPKEDASIWLGFLLLYICLLPLLSLPYANRAGQEGSMFVLPEVLTPVLGCSFVPYLWASPFLVFLLWPFWTPVSYSNYLTFPPQETEGQILWE